MKYSNYNVCVKYDDITYILYNILSEAVIQLDNEGYQFYKNCLSPEYCNDSRIHELYKRGILIDEDYNEIDFIRYADKKYGTMNDSLQLTIAPTMNCNCKCPYCFETPHEGHMSQKTMDGVLSFIRKQYEAMNFKFLHVDWFGGEPMLCWDIIKELSHRIIDYSEEARFAYSAGIITNGTILNKEIVSEYEQIKINSVQITIDGDRDTHDKRRMFKNNSGTYNVILNNLKYFSGTEIAVNIRVNIDRRNMNAFNCVKKDLSIAAPHCGIYPAMVETFTETNKIDPEDLMDSNEFSEKVKAKFLLNDLSKRSLPPRFIACQAHKTNAFGIDERGYLYKCWNELGIPEKAFATVFDYPKGIVGKNLVNYVGKDYLSDPECQSCKVLPLCMGGCAKQRQISDKLPCIAEKYCIEEFVVDIWKNKRKEASHDNYQRIC